MIARARGIAAVLLVLTFSVGALAGMALEEGLGLDWFDFLDEDEDAPGRVLEGLGLSAEQRESADAILDRQEDRLEEYWEGRVPEIRAILDESYAEMRAILSTEQRVEFDRRVGEQRGRVPLESGD